MDLLDEVYSTDVLIVGGGGAGARAAIEASRNNAEVLLAVKGLFGRSGCTVMAEGGFNAAFGFVDPEDSESHHFEDTVEGGRFLNNQELVEVLVSQAKQRLIDLESYGAAFDRVAPDKLAQRYFGGQRYRRTVHKGDKSGHEMMFSLMEEVSRQGVDILDEVAVTKLIASEGRVAGAIGLDLVRGKLLLFRARAIVIATGGAGRMYSITTNPIQKTGDGYALALNAGAELADMEMVQFHPTGMVFPSSSRGLLVTEAVRGEGGKLYNAGGERFMFNYDKRGELSTRDVATRAIFREIREGRGSEHEGVYLDISHLSSELIEEKLGTMLKQFQDVGVDIREQAMEVSPTAHHFMGGIRIDSQARSTVPNLFSCGEASAGVHGANRLGGNSLAETQIFGAIAGRKAAEEAKRHRLCKISRREVEGEHGRIYGFEGGNGTSPYELKAELQSLMWENVGIIRTRESLNQALRGIARIEEKAVSVGSGRRYNLELLQAIELENMLQVAQAMVKSALLREESRGAHFRADFPEEDSEWLLNTKVTGGNGDIAIKTSRPVITRMKP